MQRTKRFGENIVVLAVTMVLAMSLAACRGPDDDEEPEPLPDADVVADAEVLPDADDEPGDAGVVDADEPVEDADIGDGDIEEEQDPREVLALCLSEMGAVVYGAYWCGACRMQRYQFAPFHELINYVDCYFDPEIGLLDDMKEECQAVELVEEDGTVHGIEAFPTWTFDENPHYSFFVGATDMPTLAELSGCPWLGEPSGE
jgi:hypothetical protein